MLSQAALRNTTKIAHRTSLLLQKQLYATRSRKTSNADASITSPKHLIGSNEVPPGEKVPKLAYFKTNGLWVTNADQSQTRYVLPDKPPVAQPKANNIPNTEVMAAIARIGLDPDNSKHVSIFTRYFRVQEKEPSLALMKHGESIIKEMVTGHFARNFPHLSHSALSVLLNQVLNTPQISQLPEQLGIKQIVPSSHDLSSKQISYLLVSVLFLAKGYSYTLNFIYNNLISNMAGDAVYLTPVDLYGLIAAFLNVRKKLHFIFDEVHRSASTVAVPAFTVRVKVVPEGEKPLLEHEGTGSSLKLARHNALRELIKMFVKAHIGVCAIPAIIP